MEDIRQEVVNAISGLEDLKSEWPRMKTQDVIDLLKRLDDKIKLAQQRFLTVNQEPKVVYLHQTTHGCPCQWEGETNDGRHIYIRYRWGFLSCEVGGLDIYGEQIGGKYDGIISEEDMKRHISSASSLLFE